MNMVITLGAIDGNKREIKSTTNIRGITMKDGFTLTVEARKRRGGKSLKSSSMPSSIEFMMSIFFTDDIIMDVCG